MTFPRNTKIFNLCLIWPFQKVSFCSGGNIWVNYGKHTTTTRIFIYKNGMFIENNVNVSIIRSLMSIEKKIRQIRQI